MILIYMIYVTLKNIKVEKRTNEAGEQGVQYGAC